MSAAKFLLFYLCFKEVCALSGEYPKYHIVTFVITRFLEKLQLWRQPNWAIVRRSCAGNFWHITDLHWDPTYKVTDDPELVCASSGKQPADNAGKFGAYVCDSPWHLINSSVYAMKEILPDPDFIVWTGYVFH